MRIRAGHSLHLALCRIGVHAWVPRGAALRRCIVCAKWRA